MPTKHCAKCNSKNIEQETMKVYNTGIIYIPFSCRDCGCKFNEYYYYEDTDIETG